MRKRLHKNIFGLIISLALIFTLSGAPSLLPAGAEARSRGTVLYANNDEELFFINLGEAKVERGDFVEVFKGSRRIATGAIKTVMSRMSEVSVIERYRAVNIGDRTLTHKLQRGLS